MKPTRKQGVRPTLRSVLGRGHLSVALLAVGLAGISLTLLGVLALRVYANHNLHLIARSINYTVEAAVVFDDSAAANESLALIASNEEVAEAKVFNNEGELLAHWQRGDTGMLGKLEVQVATALLDEPVNLPILHQQQKVGHTELVGQGRSLLLFLLSGLAGILFCTILSALAAQYLSRRLLSNITRPLRGLASVAHAARRERSFDRRVPEAPIAELNELGNDFNALLDELEVWHSHLQNENQTLAHQASHDSLTGLPNRAFFEGRLNRSVRNAARQRDHLALLFLDSDHFKQINDTLGHAVGDEVLISVADRVRAQLREHDLVARLGGDEFAVLLTPLQSRKDAEQIAEKIVASMKLPVQLDSGRSIATSLSVGIAYYPDDGADPASLLNAADAAMYEAKRKRRGHWQVAQTERSASEIKNRS
ncbi:MULTISPECIES: diguanylate cyclase domain-containing protein [Pseudomonas]|jgi:diguanylate cyclase (GGDEF)-like protein|uniref:Diguanylate cyclase n=1 Tax=Pseudomonas monteilii TaxID=76759 RepID=A0A177KIY7_9PSED|nr:MULTISPECIES: diguanylate cyclase [Pseudomonas]MDR2316242.1 diguanylate cyclase [Pseudomonas sp.]AYN17976.1 GGDEF domain-containing protein [Pseudomonas monteilii]AYN98312.1 diguanylate cyclase [Pseudomonas sp. LTGT-11-2Z]MBA6087677.1 diguanylate cyclase [Pseudomonas monteilii]MBA6101983.1 diguanylate cyclase [Pseudomonas monteilii]